jgi:uncharacterized protein (TIGR00369 family)
MEGLLPYSHWCYVCGRDNPIGFKVVFRSEGGRIKLEYTPELHRQGYLGVVHGGVISTLLDEAMGWAPTLVRKRFFVTGELTIRYIKPFPVEKTMVIEAWAEKVTNRMAIARGELKDREGGLYAKAQGKYLPMSLDETMAIDRLLIYEPQTLRIFQEGQGDAPLKR